MAVKRYNAGIQRAKGLLEIAAALYDTSLSYQTRRAAEGVLQTDSRVGRVLRLSLGVNRSAPENRVPISFTTGNFREIIAVAQGVYSLAWVNPSVLLTMAYRGKGPFKKRLPLRTIAVFPSFDVMGFAVHESTGITSLAQIKQERKALRVSTGTLPRNDIEGSATMLRFRRCSVPPGLHSPTCANGAARFIRCPTPAILREGRRSRAAPSMRSSTKGSRAGVKLLWTTAFVICPSRERC